tara:strand:+ start:1104 stop:2654 length:1551 start_codon:yes stop_codon:yes gene_type:complete
MNNYLYSLPDEIVQKIFNYFMIENRKMLFNRSFLNIPYVIHPTRAWQSKWNYYFMMSKNKILEKQKKLKINLRNNILTNTKEYSLTTKIYMEESSGGSYLYSNKYNNSASFIDPYNKWCFMKLSYLNEEWKHNINVFKNQENLWIGYDERNEKHYFIQHTNQTSENNALLKDLKSDRKRNRELFKKLLDGITRIRIMKKLLKDKGFPENIRHSGDIILYKRLSWNEMIFGNQRSEIGLKNAIIKKTMCYCYNYNEFFTSPIENDYCYDINDIEHLWDLYNQDNFKKEYYINIDKGVDVSFRQGRYWDDKWEKKRLYVDGRVNSLMKVYYKYEYQQYQRIKYTNDKRVIHLDNHDWKLMSLQDRKYAKWFIDLKVAILGNVSSNGNLLERMVFKIRYKEYDYTNTDWIKVVRDRYNYITKTHPNRKCRLYDRKLYWKYLNSIYPNPNDYGKYYVNKKIYGKDYTKRTLEENKLMYPGRRKAYHNKIKTFKKEMNNYIYASFYYHNPHKRYLETFHTY